MLHQVEQKMLAVLAGKMSAEDVAEKAGIPVSSALSFSQSLSEKGLVRIEEKKGERLAVSIEGESFLKNGFPEERVLAAALEGKAVSALSPLERSVGLAWAAKNGWAKVEGGRLFAIVRAGAVDAYAQKGALEAIKAGKIADRTAQDALLKRGLVQRKVEKTLFIERTQGQQEKMRAGEGGINLLTRDMLLSGSWKKSSLRGYDVSAPAEVPWPAKRHPISRLRKKISAIFSQMGFEEMAGPEVQSSFWNFDALFQPQDHPARELADTFYLRGSSPLPKDAALISRVKRAHEKGWGEKWEMKNAQKTVLRTHTTAVSANCLYERCGGKEPKKYFSIGKVYRNEATDYKHLAEFFQVEGIVSWEGATFCDLLGCLREFYSKLGFEKIRFEPSYFPYTEPSLQVTVYFGKKKQWLELGGAGIFRPEVSIPLCGRYPVLAWGLSLERPLLLLNDMSDIRDFYKSGAGWLRKQKIEH